MIRDGRRTRPDAAGVAVGLPEVATLDLQPIEADLGA